MMELESPGSDVELDVLLLMLRTNAELLGDCLAKGSPTGAGENEIDDGAVLPALAAARGLGEVLNDIVADLVRRARAEGQSWAAIGYALQVSRQAAFQRFGRHADVLPQPGDLMLADAPERAVRALRQFLSGEFEGLRAEFNQRMAEVCSVALLKSVRSRLTKQLGRLYDLGPPLVMARPGYTVVDIPILYKKGERKGRIALDPQGQIAGFFLLAANIP
jgi:hypothetical protein